MPDWTQFEAVEEAPPDWTDFEPIIKPTPYQAADIASMTAGRGKAPTGMESGTELTTAIAEDPERFLQTPLVEIPKIRAKTALGKILAAPVNVAAGLVQGAETPLGALTLPLGGPVAKGVFAGLAAKSAGEQLGEASVTKDPGQIAEGLLGAAVAPAIALHGTLGGKERALANALNRAEFTPSPEVSPEALRIEGERIPAPEMFRAEDYEVVAEPTPAPAPPVPEAKAEPPAGLVQGIKQKLPHLTDEQALEIATISPEEANAKLQDALEKAQGLIRQGKSVSDPAYNNAQDYASGLFWKAKQSKAPAPTPEAKAEPTPPTTSVEAPAETSHNWELFGENLRDDLDSFSPARTTGKVDYDLQDVADRFVEYAKGDKSGKPIDKLVTDFAKQDEASATQIRKLRQSVKSVMTGESPPAAPTPSEPTPPAKVPTSEDEPRVGTRVFEPAAGHSVIKNERTGKWDLFKADENGVKALISSFKTKKEANAAIPMEETTAKYKTAAPVAKAAQEVQKVARTEGQRSAKDYSVSFESPAGGRETVRVRQVKFGELPDSMKALVEREEKMTAEFQEWKDWEYWNRVKQGKTPITLWEKRRGEEVSHNISKESPEEEFGRWARREDLYQKEFNEAGQKLHDDLVSQKEAAETAAKEKDVAEETERQRKASEFAQYKEQIQKVQLPRGETQMMRVTDAKGTESFIKGIRYGDWFIHKREGSKYTPVVYKVSHFRSGLGISGDGFPTQGQAKDYVRALIHGKARGDWVRPDALSKDEMAHLKQIGRAWTSGGDVPDYFKAQQPPPATGQSMAGPGTPSAAQGPEIVGMGGAVPSEFEQPNTYVSNMFAAIDQDRVAMGKPPMDPTVRRTWDEDNQHALAQMNRNPDWIPDLIQEVLKRPRPLLSWENAGLVWHRAKLKAEYNNALGRVAQAFDDGRTEDLAAAKTDAANFEDKLEELDRAVGRNGTGSEAGRTLQAQKMGAGDDFTLVEMTLRKRAAVGGRRLTPEETATIQKQVDELNRLNAELVKNVADRDARLAKAEADRAMAEIRAQSVPAFDKRVLAAAERIVSRLETAGDAAAQRLKARLANLGTTPDPTIVSDAAIWASGKIARLGLDLAKTTDALVAEFSEKIRPFAQAIWEQANRLIDAASADAPEVVQRAVKKADLAGQKQDFVSTVKKLVDKKEKQKITFYVQRLARELYKNGVTDREEMVDALHAELQKAIPEITRRQTMDALSGYGDYKRLSKDKITVALRGMKGELQQIAKLEDMAKGEPPLKSGVERRTPTEVERQLIKLVNDAKNKFQIPVSNPEIQLKSSLDTLKTTLANRIKDYEDRLARKDYAPRPRREVQMDEKATQLKAQAERIKKKFREELIKDRMKNRTGWEKLMDWLTKYRRFTALSSPLVIPKLFGAAGWRVLATVAEDVAGEGLARIPGIREISERAPTEGAGGQLKATMYGFGRALTKGMEDAKKVTTTGASDIDVLYGKYGESYTGEAELASLLLNIPGRLHGAIKAPVKRLGFEKATSRLTDWHARVSQQLGEWYAKQGFAVNSEALKYRIALDAYKYGNRAIFLQDNRVASSFNSALATLERRDKTGHAPAGPKALATAARFMFPVTKVPTNIAAETLQYATGAVTGPVRAYRAIRNGLDTLTPDQADLIMREMKKGSIGAAALILGYVGYKSIGGVYEPTRKKRNIPPGSVTMFGEQIPANLLHHPVLNTIQLGAQIHRTAEEKLRTHDPEAQGLSAGLLAAAWGLADEVPFVQGPHRVFEGLANPYTREKTVGQETRSIVVPQAVAWIAQVLDGRREKRPTNIYQRVFGPPAKLQQRTIKQAVEAGIPGLRQQVPVDTRK